MQEQEPREKAGTSLTRWALLALAVGMLILLGLQVRLSVDVGTLFRRAERLDEATADTRKATHAAARAVDELVRERQGQPRPKGEIKEGHIQYAVRRPTWNRVLTLEADARPVRGTVRIANQGKALLHDVRLSVNGRRYLKTNEEIVRFAVPAGGDDRERAFALYRFVRDYRYHWFPAESSTNAGAELHCPVKFFNVYGYGHCDDAAINLAMLWQAAGLKARVWELQGHVVAEVRYDDAWHVFDPDGETYFLTRDNKQVASFEAIHREPYLVIRTRFGLAAYDQDRVRIARYYADGDNRLMPLPKDYGHNLTLDLLPGEEANFDWFAWDRDLAARIPSTEPVMGAPWWHADSTPGFHCADHANAPPYMGKARFVWELPADARRAGKILAGAASENGKGALARVRMQDLALVRTADTCILRNKTPHTPGTFLFYRRLPFVLIGGDFRCDFAPGSSEDWVEVQVLRRADAKGQPDIAVSKRFSAAGGRRTIYMNFDRAFAGEYPFATYEYGIKLTVCCSGDGGIGRVRIAARTQATPFCPSALNPGGNALSLSAESQAEINCTLDFTWLDDRGLQRIEGYPQPVAEEILPGRRLRLSWERTPTSDGLPPAWYHVCVSPRPDFLRPVAPGFDTRISGAQTTWVSPEGFLQPGRTYHWRVRATDGRGFSSAFSAPRRFAVTRSEAAHCAER